MCIIKREVWVYFKMLKSISFVKKKSLKKLQKKYKIFLGHVLNFVMPAALEFDSCIFKFIDSFLIVINQ